MPVLNSRTGPWVILSPTTNANYGSMADQDQLVGIQGNDVLSSTIPRAGCGLCNSTVTF
ncbi:hypothetical protein EI94DRAFT_1724583, partial [Lactarius quietus]